MLASNRIDFPPSHCFCHPFSRRYQTQLEPSGELDLLACVQGTTGARFDRCAQPVRPASVRMSTKPSCSSIILTTDASGSSNTGSSMGTGDTRTGATCVITTASCMMGCLSEKPARVGCGRNAGYKHLSNNGPTASDVRATLVNQRDA